MKAVSITEAKNRLSALIEAVQAGDDVLILDRGVPVARLSSAAAQDPDDLDGRRARLIRAGILRPGKGGASRKILDEPPPPLPDGVSVVEALLEERREGR